jgi:hypothetical protein
LIVPGHPNLLSAAGRYSGAYIGICGKPAKIPTATRPQ